MMAKEDCVSLFYTATDVKLLSAILFMVATPFELFCFPPDFQNLGLAPRLKKKVG